MGRRAADVTTPVPVLVVPALVGVHGLKTTGEDRTAGVLLHSWGLHCSVGVQTSPGISRPPSQHSDQLTDTLPVTSHQNTQTSNSYVNEETQYVEISRLTRSDNEKRAILKQKSEESKTKKEVTFKAPGGEASHNVTSTQRNRNGTYCFARAIKNNPHFTGNTTNVRPKLKPSARYTNGSVVDSEAIGGISVDRNEAVPIKSGTFHERDQIRKQGQNTEHCGRMQRSSAAQHFGTLQKICSLCDKRQSVTTEAVSLCENNPAASACSLKSALTALSTETHVHTSHMERNRNMKPNQHQITDSIMVGDNRKQALPNEEVRFGKTAHPTCPLHSRPNLITLLQTHAAGDQTSNQLANTQRAKAVNITKATIEIKQDTNFKSFTEPTQDNKIPHPTSLTLTPQTETATKSTNPHSHSYSKVPKSPQCNSAQYNVPQNTCGSVHTTPGNTLSQLTHSGAAVIRAGNATKNNAHQKTSVHLSTKVPPPRIQNVQKVCPTNTTQLATNTTLQISEKSPNSIITNASDSNLHHLSIVAPQSPLNEHAVSDQATHTSTKAIQARQINSINTKSGSLFHESDATISPPCIRNSTQSISLKKSSVSLKNAPSTVALSSSMPKENQSNELRHNQTSRTNKPNHENQSVVCSVSKQENHSKANPLTLSRLLMLSKKQKRDTDVSTNNPESLMNVTTELHTDETKLSSNVSNEFVEHESKQHETSNLSQVTKLQNFISVIKSSSPCLHNHVNMEQLSQRYTKSQRHCDPSPLVQTAQEADAKIELFALGTSCKHTNTKAESGADNQPPPSYSTISPAQTLDHVTHSRAHQHTDSPSQLSFTTPVPFKNNGGPEYNLIPPSATLQEVAPPCPQSSEVEGDSTLSPAPTQLCPEDSSLTHSPPADAATLFPPSSPWCWKPAILQQKLESVEANLAANKDRITTLLNIIHDLEMCHTPASGRRCFKTGQDVKTCSTCQKTACIVYSVEYDFRQQERCFLEVLNFSPRRNNASSVHPSQPFKFNLLRTVIIKSLAKSKVKSKKLCRTMFKWLPRKSQQV